jgi:HlyD family secretion protein
MELRAPQDGYVQDIGTHTKGAVVPAGSVVMNIVPVDDPLLAEVYLDHKDVGFVGRGQKARLKLAAFEFQRYGMVDATVETISQDAISDIKQQEQIVDVGYRGYLELETQYLERDGVRFALRPGMRVVAEINVGTRSALDFVLSPIQRAVSEAGTER